MANKTYFIMNEEGQGVAAAELAENITLNTPPELLIDISLLAEADRLDVLHSPEKYTKDTLPSVQ